MKVKRNRLRDSGTILSDTTRANRRKERMKILKSSGNVIVLNKFIYHVNIEYINNNHHFILYLFNVYHYRIRTD